MSDAASSLRSRLFVGLQYLLPSAGGFWIDDSPSLLDPLEAQPELVPALYDNDRTTSTTINLGDEAPRGRDYGGDYRNIYLDFGEPVTMWWNFVGHGKPYITQAQRDWQAGSARFGEVHGFDGPRLEAPPVPWAS